MSAAVATVGARIARRGRNGTIAAATGAALAGAAQEWPPIVGVAPAVALTSAARSDPGAALAGAAVAVGTRRVWPVAPRHGAELAPRRIPDAERRPSPDGAGVRIVVNPGSGSAMSTPPTEQLAKALPGADVVELVEGVDLQATLRDGADGDTVAVGAAGGDGTLNAAAAVALDLGVPLVPIPAGTLNHLARDLGMASLDDAVDAVRAGTVIRMDVGVIDGRPFLNTASFGGYTEIVDAREQLERRVGKWPALAIALVRVLRTLEPLPVEIDGRRRDVWLVFVGNCRYAPPGFGPSWREQLDDGLLDVRLVDGRHPFARSRLVLAVLTGTLARCAVYEERRVQRLDIHSVDGPLRVAVDGEVFDAGRHVIVEKRPRALAVAVPAT